MGSCKCCIKNGSDVLDFLVPVAGGTAANATYALGLTHYTCGGRKMLVADSVHPVIAQLNVEPVGTPIDIGNGAYCQECQIAGTVTYKPCCGCEPRTEYVTMQVCLPCSSAVTPKLGIEEVVASPKPITYYQNGCCGCCSGTYSSTNQIAITTSINVATA